CCCCRLPSNPATACLSLPDALPILQLADGGPAVGSVRDAVHDEAAHAADPLPAVGVEGDGVLALLHESFVHDVERLARHVVSREDRKSTRLNSSHQIISYAVFCLKK